MDREQATQALNHMAEHPITRIAAWVIRGLFGALVAVSTAFVAYYANDMRDTLKAVVERVDKLEHDNQIRQAQWDAYREVYVQDVKRNRERETAHEDSQRGP